MPTRKISEREKLTIFARQASDDELDQAYEIISIERRIRAGNKPTTNPGNRRQRSRARSNVPPGPPNPPKPDNDNPQG